MIKDTIYDLELRLQRVKESLSTGNTSTNTANTNIDLEVEEKVIGQCLGICENAQSCLETLQCGQAFLQQEATTRPGTMQEPIFVGNARAVSNSHITVVATTPGNFFVERAVAEHGSTLSFIATNRRYLKP